MFSFQSISAFFMYAADILSVTNFIDLSGGTLNKIIGGGYGRYSNTIDMVRKSVNPYYRGGSGEAITNILNDLNFGKKLLIKKFEDINYS